MYMILIKFNDFYFTPDHVIFRNFYLLETKLIYKLAYHVRILKLYKVKGAKILFLFYLHLQNLEILRKILTKLFLIKILRKNYYTLYSNININIVTLLYFNI